PPIYTRLSAVVVDADGQAILAGSSDSGFLMRLDPTGSQLTYSRYFAPSGASDFSNVWCFGALTCPPYLYGPQALSIDSEGNLYSVGVTGHASQPTPNAYLAPSRSRE